MKHHGTIGWLVAAAGWAVVAVSCGARLSTAPSAARNAVPPLSVNDDMRLKYYYYEAMNQQQQGHYDAAFDLLRHCLAIHPQASEVYYALSAYYAELDDDSLALDCMKRAAALNGENAYYQERLAMGYVNAKEYPEAISTYERLYADNKTRSDVLEILLRLYNQQRDYGMMVNTIERIETVEGSNEQTALSKMRVYSMMGDKEKELNVLKELSEKHPSDMNYRVMMGNWLLQNSQAQDAYNMYQEVLTEEPDNLSAKLSLMDYYNATGQELLADSLQEALLIDENTPSGSKMTLMRNVVASNEQHGGDSTEVLNLFKRILAEPQHNSDMTELYAAYMRLKKMPQDSIDIVLQQAIEISPDNAGARIQLIQSRYRDSDFDAIIALSEDGVKYNPDEMLFYYFLGMVYYQQDRHDEALAAFRRGISQINEESDKQLVCECYSLTGSILHEQQRHQEAFAAFDSALHWKPDDLGTLNNYAYYLSERGQELQKAEQMSYRTIKAEPKNATFLDTYAWILFKQERFEEAKIYMEQTLQNDTAVSAVVLEHAGDIYAMNNDMEKALEYWQQAREAGGNSKVLIRKIKIRKYIKEDEKQ